MSHFLTTLLSLLGSFILSLLLSKPTTASIAHPLFYDNLTNPFVLSINQSSLNVSATDPQYKCRKGTIIRTDYRPRFSDCYRAIRELPGTHNTGTFHTSGLNDVWRLPRVEKFGQCRAQVELENRARVPSSWIAVVAALDQLNVLCRRKTGSQEEKTGGWMLLTADNKIKVSLIGPKDPHIPHLSEMTVSEP